MSLKKLTRQAAVLAFGALSAAGCEIRVRIERRPSSFSLTPPAPAPFHTATRQDDGCQVTIDFLQDVRPHFARAAEDTVRAGDKIFVDYCRETYERSARLKGSNFAELVEGGALSELDAQKDPVSQLEKTVITASTPVPFAPYHFARISPIPR